MGEPARAWPVEDDLDDGPLTPAEEAALLQRVEAAEAEPEEDIPAEVLWAELGLSDRH